MPLLNIRTNVNKSDIPKTFLADATNLVAEMLGKPPGRVAIEVVPDVLMSFGGTTEPCAQVFFMSFGKLGKAENISHSEKICNFLETSLGVSSSRLFIQFKDVDAHEIGKGGTTLEVSLGLNK